MAKPRVYLETTIPSLLTAKPSRDVLIAGQQQATLDWWELERHCFEVVISALVLAEISAGDPVAAAERLDAVRGCQVLAMDEEIERLTKAILHTRLIPPKAYTDAAHIAAAARHGIEYLLTWNCRHIANAAIVERVRQACRDAGYEPPMICTPLELMGDLLR